MLRRVACGLAGLSAGVAAATDLKTMVSNGISKAEAAVHLAHSKGKLIHSGVAKTAAKKALTDAAKGRALTETPLLNELRFSYGDLEPAFDSSTTSYTLHVPKCSHKGHRYHLLALDVTVSGDYGTQVELRMGDYAEQEDAVAVAILSQESGIEAYDFSEGEMSVTVTDPQSGGATTYAVNVVADDADAQKVTDKCLFCPEHGDAEGAGDAAADVAAAGDVPADAPKVSCSVPHATLLDEICTCDKGWVGALELNEESRVWEGTCVREPVQGAWPCQGEAPFTCGVCPSCQDAAAIMADLAKSRNTIII